MKKSLSNLLLLFFLIIIGLESCVMYDGPTRIFRARETPVLPPPVEKVVGKPLSKAEYMEKTFNDIKSNLEEADVTMIEDSIKVLFPNNIVYNTKSATRSSDYQQPLQKFSTLLGKYRKTNILITGHTDSRGNPIANKELSKQRADMIKSYLISEGIKNYRLESWGLGSMAPIADNETEEGRSKNRRVEFVVLYDEK